MAQRTESRRALAPELIKLQIPLPLMPLDPTRRAEVSRWLRQVADELDRGEHWDTCIFSFGL